MRKRKEKLVRCASISLPQAVVKQIDRIVEEFDYWPSRAAFIREACLEKVERHGAELETRRGVEPPLKRRKRPHSRNIEGERSG
ncbi:MAG: ribbon-helix-helix domain-containing protein [Candidatus Geothermarchaeales archaeon]